MLFCFVSTKKPSDVIHKLEMEARPKSENAEASNTPKIETLL